MREHKTLKQIYIWQFYLAILYLKKEIEDRYVATYGFELARSGRGCLIIWFQVKCKSSAHFLNTQQNKNMYYQG